MKFLLTQLGLSAATPQKRVQMLRDLRDTADPSAIGVLSRVLLKDSSPAVRAEAALALGEIESAKVIKPLVAALNDRADGVLEAALQSLRRRGDRSVIEPIVKVLLGGSPTVQYQAAQALKGLNWTPQAVPEQAVFYVAAGDFKRATMFGSAATPSLVRVLQGDLDDRRVEAARALAELGDPTAFQPLIDALKDKEGIVRSAAANALAQLGDKRAVPELLTLLKDEQRNVRVSVVDALGHLGGSEILPHLRPLLKDKEWEVRAVLADAIGKLGDPGSAGDVLTLLEDKDGEVRQNAMLAAGRVRSEAALECLVLALVDEHIGVRQAAARAIKSVDPYWEQSPRVQSLVPQLRQALRLPNTGVQVAAANVLRRITGLSAVELANKEAEMAVARKAGEAFGLVEPLLRDGDDEVRLAAVEAVVRLKLPAGVPALQGLLSDKSRWVKQAADAGLQALLNTR